MTKMDKRTDHDAHAASSGQVLRRQAEAIAHAKAQPTPENILAMSPDAMRLMLHELRVHQIELELQNEELRRRQVELDAGRARYFDLYDMAPVGYCTLSEQGLILETNFTAATLLGAARSELVKRPFSRFILKADQDIYYLCHKRLLESGDPQTCELRMTRKDGTPFWAHLGVTAAQDDGAPVLRVMLSDISERHRLDQALQEKNMELERARQVAEKASRAKSEFLSSMSHELRSPLNSILGFAQLMESGSPPPSTRQKASIDQILHAGWYLLELINEILDLTLIESGKVSLSLETLSLPEILRDCQTMVEPLAQKNGISMHFPEFDSPYFINADRTRVKQVVINLLSNAIKYNRAEGTVEVTCSALPTQRLRISVRDSGQGLSPEKLMQLFQPFNRLGQEKGAKEGTGIGLVVSKQLVELMGGEIGAQSTVGAGSVFWFELNQALEFTPAPLAGAKNEEDPQ